MKMNVATLPDTQTITSPVDQTTLHRSGTQDQHLNGVSTVTSERYLQTLGQQIVRALEYVDTWTAIHKLRELSLEGEEFSRPYMKKLIKALQTGDWEPLGDSFVNQEFIGRTGYILLVGPFTRLQAGEEVTKFTALFGRIVDFELPITDLPTLMSTTCGPLHQALPATLPFTSIAVCGNIGLQEAFLSPDGWCWPQANLGPALVNITSHQSRCSVWVTKRIRKIFAPETADLILALRRDQAMQFQEYCLHEAGHAAGMGLQLKLAHDLMPDSHHKGWEEYKTDIVGFLLAGQALSPTQVGQLVAATMLIRFGIDAHRPGGAGADHDAMATLLLLDHMIQSGALEVLENGQLSLTEVSYAGLYEATATARAAAIELLAQEQNCIDCPQEIMAFYDQQHPTPEAVQIFAQSLAACA